MHAAFLFEVNLGSISFASGIIAGSSPSTCPLTLLYSDYQRYTANAEAGPKWSFGRRAEDRVPERQVDRQSVPVSRTPFEE